MLGRSNSWVPARSTGGAQPVIVHPLETGEDDWPRLFSIALANPLRSIYMAAGEWLCKSVSANPGVTPGAGRVPNFAHFYGAPGFATRIFTELAPTPGGGHAVSPFTRNDLGYPTHVTELLVDAVPGPGRTILVTSVAGMVASTPGTDDGSHIFLGYGVHRCSTYVVMGISGAGPYTVTLDRKIKRYFPVSGTTVGVFDQPRHIRITDLCFVGGTGDRAVSIVAGWKCRRARIKLLSTRFGDYQMSWDTGSYDCVDADVDVIDTIYPGGAMEGSEGCTSRRYNVHGCGSADTAYIVQGSIDWAIYDQKVTDSVGSGLHIGYTNDPTGSSGGRVFGSSYGNCGSGIIVDGGSSGLGLFGNECADCTFGLNVQTSTMNAEGSSPPAPAVPDRVFGYGNRFLRNACHVIVGAARSVHLNGTESQDATGTAFECLDGGKLELDGISCSENVADKFFTNLSTMHIRNGRITTTKTTGTADGPMVFRQESPGALMTVTSVEVVGPAAHGAVLSAGSGKVILQDVKSTGFKYPSYAGGLGHAAQVELRESVDLSSASLAITNDTGGSHTMTQRSGLSTIALAATNVTLSWDQFQTGLHVYNGTPASARSAIYPPIIGHVWTARNDTLSQQTVTAISTSGTGIAIAPGATVRFYWDGTNMVQA